MAIDAQKGPRRSARTDLVQAPPNVPICGGGFHKRLVDRARRLVAVSGPQEPRLETPSRPIRASAESGPPCQKALKSSCSTLATDHLTMLGASIRCSGASIRCVAKRWLLYDVERWIADGRVTFSSRRSHPQGHDDAALLEQG